MTPKIDLSLDLYVEAALGKKAKHLVVLDVHELSSVADAFIICSGRSNRQVKAIAEHIQVELKKHKIKPLSTEGMSDGHWVLMDYGHIIIHIFYEPVRSFYDLESLWVDAARIKTKSMEHLETEGENQTSYTEFNGDHDDDYSETL
jgi:ribosome-associated protein